MAPEEDSQSTTPASVAAEPEVDGDAVIATFRTRAVCKLADMLVAFLAAAFLLESLAAVTPLGAYDMRAAAAALTVVYFAACWSSRLGATPIQYLFNLMLVDHAGRVLRPGRALGRAVASVAMTLGVFLIFGLERDAVWQIPGVLAFAGLFTAALTPRRQAVHDLALGTYVVNRRAARSAAGRARFERIAAGEAVRAGRFRQRIGDFIADTFVICVPMFFMWVAIDASVTRNHYASIAYALNETTALKTAIAEHYAQFQTLPTAHEQLGVPVRTRFPDGGWYDLDRRGRIEIRFEKKRHLRDGALILEPVVGADGLTWVCRGEGIVPRYLPSSCRN